MGDCRLGQGPKVSLSGWKVKETGCHVWGAAPLVLRRCNTHIYHNALLAMGHCSLRVLRFSGLRQSHQLTYQNNADQGNTLSVLLGGGLHRFALMRDRYGF